jgi:hypothetical protein
LAAADVEPLAAADVEPSERADAEPSDQANAEPSARADAEPSGPAAGRAATWFAPEDDPTVLCQSADGPVLRSRYGDFRPPVPVGRPKGPAAPPDPASLTGLGLTRRTWGHVGSRLFTLVFVAIFVLILVQVVIGMVSSAASP